MKIMKLLTGMCLLMVGGYATAAATGGAGALPWEAGLTSIVTSFTGPVAYAISVLGIIIGIGILIFGNDLNAFGRTIVFLVLAASVIVTAANTLQIFTGVGATTAVNSLAMLGALLTVASAMTTAQLAFLSLFKSKISECRGDLETA